MVANVLLNALNALLWSLSTQIQNYIIPGMLLSMIMPKETSLFPINQGHCSIIPLHKFPLFLFHYSSSAPEERLLNLLQFSSSSATDPGSGQIRRMCSSRQNWQSVSILFSLDHSWTHHDVTRPQSVSLYEKIKLYRFLSRFGLKTDIDFEDILVSN